MHCAVSLCGAIERNPRTSFNNQISRKSLMRKESNRSSGRVRSSDPDTFEREVVSLKITACRHTQTLAATVS